ncbi:MAG: hypothetical protein M3Y66_08355 [Actinomycetota bacterium]|nr:hypothetical protein [Actinomycetota bacterium]
MTEHDEEELWRSIVENYGERITLDPSTESTPETASQSNTEPPSDSLAESSTDPGPPPIHPPSQRDEPDLLDAWDDPDDHFVPPDPPPLPNPEPPRLLAWVGVFGVPVLVIVVSVLKISMPSFASLLCLAWFVGGFGYLVATMRRDGDPDERDDGAVL